MLRHYPKYKENCGTLRRSIILPHHWLLRCDKLWSLSQEDSPTPSPAFGFLRTQPHYGTYRLLSLARGIAPTRC